MSAALTARSTCPYCGVGCGVLIEHNGTHINGVRGDPDHPANRGRLCSKGQTLHFSARNDVQRQLRLLTPMARASREQPFAPIGWDDALDRSAAAIGQTVEQHGPDAVGLYLSGQLGTEDYYVFNKLGKALIGTHNVDTYSRLCMSSAVAGYKASLGADSVPGCYDDLTHAQTVFITGSNLAWAHPVLMRRLEDARRANPAQRWIVADPRRTETAAAADLHLQLLPGTDVVLLHAMLHLLVWEGLVDMAYVAAHTEGFAALRDRVREFTPANAARTCGLKADDIVTAARWFGQSTPSLSMYCQGLNQSAAGTDKNRALINLHLATGQIGRPGAGPLSLTGQPNAMGGREVGALANLLPGHRNGADPAHRAEVAALWGIESLPEPQGKAAIEMFEAAADGQIKTMWIACTDPATSLPDSKAVQRALQRVDCLIVQDAYRANASARQAHLLLPAASWGEKDGTVTNSERCISRTRAAVPPPGQARPDWLIARDVAQRLEKRLPSRRAAGHAGSMFAFRNVEAVWLEHRETTRGRDLDITGLTWAMLEQEPRQWPWPEGAASAKTRLFGDGRFLTDNGRARFADIAWRGPAEARSAAMPFGLTTGRLRDQWHTMSRTGGVARLFDHGGGPSVQLHPRDLARLNLDDGDLVRVSSRRAVLVLPALQSESVAPTQAFIAMHWGPAYLRGGVNVLTTPARCPQSRQPELKHAAVKIEAAALPWRLAAAAWLPAEQALAVRAELAALMDGCDTLQFAAVLPFGREPQTLLGVQVQAAAAVAPDENWVAAVEALLGLDAASVQRYADRRGGRRRAVKLAADGSLAAFLLTGDAAAQRWAQPLLRERSVRPGLARALLAGLTEEPGLAPAATRSAQVCTCHDVSEAAIRGAAADCEGDMSQRLQSVQQRLRCGTECGSCLPAVRALVVAALAVSDPHPDQPRVRRLEEGTVVGA